MEKNNDDDLLDDDIQFKDEYELNIEEEDALLAFNEDEVQTSDSCVDRSGEVEYVDEEGNPVSIQEGQSLEVVGIHEDYGYSEPGNEEEDVLEVDVDQEFDALVQETDGFDSPRSIQARKRERTPQLTPLPHHSTPSEVGQGDAGKVATPREVGDAEHEDEAGREDDDEEEEEEDGEKRRGRFRAERGEALPGAPKRRDDIPDSLDAVISAEDAAKVDAYLSREEERKRGGRRGGRARGGGSFRRGGHNRTSQNSKPPQQHIDPWMPHSGPMAMQQGPFSNQGMGGPQRGFPGVPPCMNDNNLRAKIFVNPQFHNGRPGMQQNSAPGLMIGRPPQFQQMAMQQRGMFPPPLRQDPFPFSGPPVVPCQEQRPPPFMQNLGQDQRGFQRPPHPTQTTFPGGGPHSAPSSQFSSNAERFMPTSRPGLEPFEMPPPVINFGPGRNGEFQHRHAIEPWAPHQSGNSGIQTGARLQSHLFGSPPHYTNAPLQPLQQQQQHLTSPVAAHPFPSISQHQPGPPQATVPARQLPHDTRYQHGPPLPHFQPQQRAPPPQMMDTSRPPPQRPPAPPMAPPHVSPVHPVSSPPRGYRMPHAGDAPPFQHPRGVSLGKRMCEGAPQGSVVSCTTAKVGRMDSPRMGRVPSGRTVNSSNIKEVPIVENLPPPEPVKVPLPKEVEEDAETLELRRKIEEQKKLREQVLRIKAERRKLAAMQRQADLLEQKLHSTETDVRAGDDVGDVKPTVAAAGPATAAPQSTAPKTVQRPVQAVAPQGAQQPAKPPLSVKQRLGLSPGQQAIPTVRDAGAGGGLSKKVVIVRRNSQHTAQAPRQQGVATVSRNIISLTPQAQGSVARGPASRGRAGATAAVRGGRPVQRAVVPQQLQQQGPDSSKVIKIVPSTGVRAQAPPLPGRGGGVGQRGVHHQAAQSPVPQTTQVLVTNLSVSTTEAQLRHLGSTCGVITGIVLDRSQRRAVIGFREQQQAVTFQKKYQRHMLDLSMIQVSLLPP